jgi:hypothetical protein
MNHTRMENGLAPNEWHPEQNPFTRQSCFREYIVPAATHW